MKIGDAIPEVTFQTRVRDDSLADSNPYRWQERTSTELFAGRRCLLFALPGAFTPTCSTYQLPGFEAAAADIKALGIDAIYCLSVNDAFVMNQWARSIRLREVEVIPDGSGEFTDKMGMLVRKDNLGFGARSWRYAAVIRDGRIEGWFEEPGRCDDCVEDPYGETTPEHILSWLHREYERLTAA